MEKVVEIKNKFDIDQIIKINSDYQYNIVIKLHSKGKYQQNKLELIDYLSQNYDNLKEKVKHINLFVPYERIPKDEFKYLFDLYQIIQDNVACYVNVNHEINSVPYRLNWNLKAIIKANTEIDKVCDFIKNKELTQFEALAYIHNYVSTVADYNLSVKNEGYDQSFVGAFEEIPQFVCAGYSSLMKEIIDTLNMSGLKCDLIHFDVKDWERNFRCGHQKCLIQIKDEKYSLDQTVFDDPTFDYIKNAVSSVYSFFATSNDCHDESKNNRFKYYNYGTFVREKKDEKNNALLDNYLKSERLYNNSENQINQKLIETVYANLMHKVDKSLTPKQIYGAIAIMAKESLKNQLNRKFIGNLTKSRPIISKREIAEICKLQEKADCNTCQNILEKKV